MDEVVSKDHKRTSGRRRWETHWSIWSILAVSLISVVYALFFLYARINQVRTHVHNPHYEADHCFDCHEANGSKMTAKDCYGCHDMLTRRLTFDARAKRAAMSEKPCTHPIKISDPARGRSVTGLCLSCHSTDKAFVAMINVQSNTYIEIDISATHPIGLMPTETIFPKTLPLNPGGQINCVTCHDQHGTDKRLHLLRLYHPGNGRPADFRPLCLDCHKEAWIPLGPKIADSVRESHELKMFHKGKSE